ncbi:tail fiber protein [Xanthomonas phage XAJ24]|uniref:Tail fiber protein n=1 Tax=Xanthomonas phage XAJ24 TaxID=1775250 RepID=A0A1I9L2B7_9CAUD|nr:tail fiber protein [Xanthomonas phage XAJ24]AMW36104.1 tail fiber protein [Xanthomonas phage XAJ24]
MAKHFRLFGRPLMADEVLPGLSVTGVLDGYTAGAAYESRLSINNPQGRCTVEVLESSLPPGAVVRVDNLTKQVVVKWAAYVEVVAEETEVPNGGFEQGDDGTWVTGEGWAIGTGDDFSTYEGEYSARFANVKTKGSDLVLPLIPAKVNDYIKVRAQVQQGSSSEGNAGARVWLTYHDAGGKQIGDHPGNLITSGKDGAWKETSAEGGAPANTAGVIVRIAAYRNKQNRPLFVDKVTWNHKYKLGQNDDDTYKLYLKVTDSANRVAYWRGTIDELGIYVTSKLYGFYETEGLQASSEFVSYNNRDMLPPEDYSIAGSRFVSWDFTSIRRELAAGVESTQVGSSFVSWEIKAIRQDYNAGIENTLVSSSFHSFTIKQHPVVNQPLDATVSARSGFVSWSFA